MDRLDDDYRHERISRREYERRRSQIERGSIVYWVRRSPTPASFSSKCAVLFRRRADSVYYY